MSMNMHAVEYSLMHLQALVQRRRHQRVRFVSIRHLHGVGRGPYAHTRPLLLLSKPQEGLGS